MRPQSCKNKGRRLQQRVVATILNKFPHLDSDDVVSTSMGAGGEDVRMSPLARSAVPLSIECKCVERLNVRACLEQVIRNTPEGTSPCIVFSRNHASTYAVIEWDVLLALLKRCYDTGEGGVPTGLADALLALVPFIDDLRRPRNDATV